MTTEKPPLPSSVGPKCRILAMLAVTFALAAAVAGLAMNVYLGKRVELGVDYGDFGRQRGAVCGERPAVPRFSDLGHLYSTSLGKLEMDLMSSHQLSERQVLDSILAEAVGKVFSEYVDRHGLDEIAEIFGKGVKVEVGDLLPSEHYAQRLKRVPPAWEKAFEVNASSSPAMRASCVEFILAGLHATDRISRAQKHGRIVYEIS